MKVTAIKQQTKRHDRYSVFVDGKYSFSLGESQLVTSGLHSGMELTTDDLSKYHDVSAEGKLFDRLLNLFSYRMRSKWEVLDYLRRHDVTPEQASSLVSRLKELGYIDDQKFAQLWVESRRMAKHSSIRKLRTELATKRIDRSIIDNVLATEEFDELDALRLLIQKKRARYPDDLKLMQYLARQGFSYSDIRIVLAEFSGEV